MFYMRILVDPVIGSSLLRYSAVLNPLSDNPTKWPNKPKQFVGKLPTNCLSVFGHFVNLALKRLTAGIVHFSIFEIFAF